MNGVKITNRLIKALKLVDIRVLDYLVMENNPSWVNEEQK